MNEFKTRLGEDGRIVIPASCRRLLHIKPGEELIIRVDENEMRVFSLKHSLRKAQNLVHKHAKNQSLTAKLKKIRQQEIDNE